MGRSVDTERRLSSQSTVASSNDFMDEENFWHNWSARHVEELARVLHSRKPVISALMYLRVEATVLSHEKGIPKQMPDPHFGRYSFFKEHDMCNQEGDLRFAGRFNFLYVPLCFREKNSLCYAFINFVDLTSLELFRQRFHGFRQWGIPGTEHVGEVCSCERHQGLSSIIQYYRNNSVMHPSVPDECKPILLSGTQRIPFPSPLKKIKMPKKLKGSDANLEEKLQTEGVPAVVTFVL
eukprot:s724_g31.t1